MGSPFEDVTETIFTNKEVLTEDYDPDEILERDDEIEQYRDALKDILFGRSPGNIFSYGKAGVGKTAVTSYMTDAVQTEAAGREEADELYTWTVNCNQSTVFQVVRQLINQAKPHEEDPFPARGLGTGDAFESLYNELDRLGGTHLLVFDEIDHLDNVDTLLYELPRARANGHIETARVGVIGISNNYTFRESLSPKVKDTLMETEISFSPYDGPELNTILTRRAEQALQSDAYDESAIARAAALAARDTGSARQAIDLLREAGNIAENDGSYHISESHIDQAREQVQRGRLVNKIRDQTTHAQLILETVALMEQDGKTPTRSKEIHSLYDRVAEKWGVEPLTTLKSIQDHLSDLRMLGFLTQHERNEGLSGGYYYEYGLDLDPSVVISTREEIEVES